MSTPDVLPLTALPHQQWRGMRYATLSQCAGAVGTLVFTNGLMLLYLTKLQFSDPMILLLISSNTGLMMLLSILAAHWADHIGIKKLGLPGGILCCLGYTGMTLGASLPLPTAQGVVAGSILLYGIGSTGLNAGWFSLLKGFVPPAITGRFFGVMRTLWQSVAMFYVFGYSLFLRGESDLWLYQMVLGGLLIGQIFRVVFYARIPEIQPPLRYRESLPTALRQVLPTPQFMPFCAYTFVLALFTTAGPLLFNLVEKRHLQLGDNVIATLGGMLMLGAILGFPLGGWIVDRMGTKMVFLFCHFGFLVLCCLFPLRDLFALSTTLYLGAIHFAWGVLWAGSSIAMSSELFAVMPASRRSLATAVWWSLSNGGGTMSGLLAAGAISLGCFQPQWQLLGQTVSDYDALLLIYGILTALMVVTLGLVPSVIGKAQWMPRSA